MTRRIHTRQRGFTLIEAVVVVLALAISIPTTLIWLGDSNQRRADAVNLTRSTALATLVMEHILADVASSNSGLGFAALSDSSAYLDTATTGLRARIAPMTSLYSGMNITYTVTISSLVGKTGVATGNAAQDLFRSVTVTVSFTAADGASRSTSVQSMVTSL